MSIDFIPSFLQLFFVAIFERNVESSENLFLGKFLGFILTHSLGIKISCKTSHINQNGQDHDSEVLPLSVRRYGYKDKDQFAQIITLERERLLDSMRYSREISDIDTGSGRSEQEPTTEITEYIIFSIDPTTFNQDFLSLDTISIPSIRTSFNPNTKTLIVKMVTREHTQIAFAVHKAIDKALARMGLDEAIKNYQGVDIDVNGRQKQADMGWGPRQPRGCPKRPSVVLEVAVSEPRKKLRQDVDIWLDPVR
ncbi:unnamed protein product [Penicillium salamii]|uniref:Uncharacterized protein n=1 Tax=Penicillium salamii TaxID=1612424 RepID=A0A9W4NQ55_9EURO|nr:unnamed protein product [Penicillium salamii]